MIYRQGDVLVMRVDDGREDLLERTEEPRDEGRIVLAYGEVTGHAHAIDDAAATLWRIAGDDRLLIVGDGPGVALRHEEHATITIPPGTYVVRRQREYVPESEDATARSVYVAD
jgi:hypothetical protein